MVVFTIYSYRIMQKLLLFLIVLFPACLFAQNKQDAIWHVGKKRMDFNANPVSITNISTNYGWLKATTIANKSGQLLFFYSGNNEDKIYDKNLNELPNGQDIINMNAPLFIPKPLQKKYYYLIDNYNYTLIDSSLNSGNGDIIEKNIQWNNITQSPIQAVHHSNCKDIWLVGHNDTAYIAYLLTENGISNQAVISPKTPTNSIFNKEMAISPDGNLFTISGYIPNGGTDVNNLTIDFGSFNRETGEFERVYYYQTSIYNRAFNISFSPNSSKLYFNAQIRASNDMRLLQVNILNNIPDFNNTIIISTYNTSGSFIPNGGMQLGNDGKIYELFTFYKQINVINNPNELGLACDYQQNVFSSNIPASNFPKFISTWFSDSYCSLDFFAENNCLTEPTNFAINNTNNIQSVLWDFGDSQTSTELEPTHIYASAGTYTVTLTVTYNDNSTDTVSKQITIYETSTEITIFHD